MRVILKTKCGCQKEHIVTGESEQIQVTLVLGKVERIFEKTAYTNKGLSVYLEKEDRKIED